jgi:hypothetical protein
MIRHLFKNQGGQKTQHSTQQPRLTGSQRDAVVASVFRDDRLEVQKCDSVRQARSRCDDPARSLEVEIRVSNPVGTALSEVDGLWLDFYAFPLTLNVSQRRLGILLTRELLPKLMNTRTSGLCALDPFPPREVRSMP